MSKPLYLLVFCDGELERFALQPDGRYRCPTCDLALSWLVW